MHWLSRYQRFWTELAERLAAFVEEDAWPQTSAVGDAGHRQAKPHPQTSSQCAAGKESTPRGPTRANSRAGSGRSQTPRASFGAARKLDGASAAGYALSSFNTDGRRDITKSAASLSREWCRTSGWRSAGPGIRRRSARSQVPVTLKPDGDGTLLTLHHGSCSAAPPADGHERGRLGPARSTGWRNSSPEPSPRSKLILTGGPAMQPHHHRHARGVDLPRAERPSRPREGIHPRPRTGAARSAARCRGSGSTRPIRVRRTERQAGDAGRSVQAGRSQCWSCQSSSRSRPAGMKAASSCSVLAPTDSQARDPASRGSATPRWSRSRAHPRRERRAAAAAHGAGYRRAVVRRHGDFQYDFHVSGSDSRRNRSRARWQGLQLSEHARGFAHRMMLPGNSVFSREAEAGDIFHTYSCSALRRST